jgi:hypothetical protein
MAAIMTACSRLNEKAGIQLPGESCDNPQIHQNPTKVCGRTEVIS